MDILIDGYNLIGADQGLRRDLESQRARLIQRIKEYKRLKGFNLILVFDGWRSGSDHETIENNDGLTIIYSMRGVKADHVVINLARTKGAGCVVISSDREIVRAIERFGGVAIPSTDFLRILFQTERVLAGALPADRDDEFLPDDNYHGRGNARLSKAERKRREKLKKLQL